MEEVLDLIEMLGLESLPTDSLAEPWMESALCSQVDPEFWFPEKGDPTAFAKRTCMACPVRAECEDYVHRQFDAGVHEHGVWAGMSRNQRRAKFERQEKEGRWSTRNVQQDARIVAMRTARVPAEAVARQMGVSVRSVERAMQRAKDAA